MLPRLLFFLLLLIPQFCIAQEYSVKELIQKVDSLYGCPSSLSYWIETKQKYLTETDTFSGRAIVYLAHRPEDSLKSHHNILIPEWNWQQIYNGAFILNRKLSDSSAILVNTQTAGYAHIRGNRIRDYRVDHFFKPHHFPNLLKDTSLAQADLIETVYHGISSFKLKFNYRSKGDFSKDERIYYFRESDLFPFAVEESLTWQGMDQYQAHVLRNIAYNFEVDDLTFDIDYHITDYDKLKNYEPKETIPLLEKGVTAPSIFVPSILSDTFKLSDYKGKIIILDFWYRSCYPCIKALPDLQKIADEYASEGVVVIGVNPYDEKEKIIPFLADRQITYNSLYNAKSVAKEYQVTAYPTLYLIGRDGKIHGSHVGWSEDFYEEMKEQLKQMK